MIFFLNDVLKLNYLQKKKDSLRKFFLDKNNNIIQNINFECKLNLKQKIYFFVLKIN